MQNLLTNSNMQNTIIFFTPEAGVLPFFATQSILARTMKERGHRVLMTRCSGFFSRCPVMDMNYLPYNASSEIKAPICAACSLAFSEMVIAYGLEFIELSDFISPETLHNISNIVANAPNDLRNFNFDGISFGNICAYDTILALKQYNLENIDDSFRQAWITYIEAALQSYLLADCITRNIQTHHFLRFNDYSLLVGASFAAYKKGIHVQSVTLAPHKSVDFQRFTVSNTKVIYETYTQSIHKWWQWRDLYLQAVQVKLVVDDMISRYGGRHAHVFSPSKTFSESNLHNDLQLSRERKTIVAFTSSKDEFAAMQCLTEGMGIKLREAQNTFPDQVSWLRAVTEYVEHNQSLQLVVRIHPREGRGALSEHLIQLHKAFDRKFERCRFVWPEDSISSYDLAEITDLALISWSTIGLELARMGIPVLATNRGTSYPGDDFIDWVETPQDYFIKCGTLLNQPNSLLTLAHAFRYYNCFNLGNSLSFADIIPSSNATFDFKGLPPFKMPEEAETLEEVIIGCKNIFEINHNRQVSLQYAGIVDEESNALRSQIRRLIHFICIGIDDSTEIPLTIIENESEGSDEYLQGQVSERLIIIKGSEITYLPEPGKIICKISPTCARLARLSITYDTYFTPAEVRRKKTVGIDRGNATWQNSLNCTCVKFYAGDVPLMTQYIGWIGLSITKGDDRHIFHDLTKPFPIPDNSVDAFQAEDVLEHISYDQLLPVMNEIFRVLKPNALFRLSVPDYGCDVLRERSVKDSAGKLVFDPGGGGTPEYPGHVWFPRIDAVRELINRSLFAKYGHIEYLHYYNMDGSFVVKPVDYSKGHVDRTPDFDERVKSPYRPMSMVIDLVKAVDKESCLFINTYYDAFLGMVYGRQEGLGDKPYKKQMRQLIDFRFGDSDFYSEGLKKAGWRSDDLIANCSPLQKAWAHENGLDSGSLSLVFEQAKHYRPDCVYLQNLGMGTKEFLATIRSYTDLIIGQIAYPLPERTDLSGFDIIFSSFPHFVDRFRKIGITAYYQPLAFEPRVLKSITKFAYSKRPVECSFVGGISPMHGKSYQLLETLAAQVPMDFWGYGAETLPPDSAIRSCHHGEVWGLEMFYLLGASKITINRHIDVAENYANNMRLFEATGCGALLITDYKDNLSDLFEIGEEIVVYHSPEECIELVRYYLSHPDEAEKIAKAGQARTLRDHVYEKRMEQTAKILSRHLRYRRERETLAMPERVSDGYRTIERGDVTEALELAWKNPTIPLQQRALVQQQLMEMYRGNIVQPFKVLADILVPLAEEGGSLLEIGCSSGYYYEVLEYLLKKQIAYAGVDYSEPMIELARDYYPEAQFFTADGANLPLADRSFRVVVSGCILLHTPNYIKHITETCRVAEKWIVVHRTPICRERQTICLSKMAYGVETVELRFNEQELLGHFAQQGFKLIKACAYLEQVQDDEYEVSYLLERAPQSVVKPLPVPPAPVRTAPTTYRSRPVVLVSRAIAFTFPLSYAYLAGQLRAQGEDVRMLFKDVSDQTLVKQIMDLNPLIVGFGNLYPELAETKVLIRMLDEAGRKFPIVIGGQMVSPTPEFAVRITGADFGVIGEGELILAELVRRLRAGEDVSDLKGLVVRRGNEVRNNGAGAFIENLSTSLPAIPYDLFPADQWLPIGAWYAKNLPQPHWKMEDRVINVHGGRGCPFTCNFCYHHSKARYRDISVMMDEAQEALIRFNGNMLYFSDDLVMANPMRARQLIEAIGKLDRPVSFQISTRFDILSRMDDELLRDLKRVGCRSMGLGLESGSDRILKIIGKNCTAQQIEEGLDRLRLVGIYPTTSIMLGQYTETLEDAVASIALMQRTVQKDPYLNYAFTLTTPFPGSALYDLIFQKGLLNDDQEFYDRYFSTAGEFKQVVNLSAMSENEVATAFSEIQRIYDVEKRKANALLGIG